MLGTHYVNNTRVGIAHTSCGNGEPEKGMNCRVPMYKENIWMPCKMMWLHSKPPSRLPWILNYGKVPVRSDAAAEGIPRSYDLVASY
jgi:hypothetical protein